MDDLRLLRGRRGRPIDLGDLYTESGQTLQGSFSAGWLYRSQIDFDLGCIEATPATRAARTAPSCSPRSVAKGPPPLVAVVGAAEFA